MPKRRGGSVRPTVEPRRSRREVRFLVLFVLLLAGSFTLISWNPVNDRVIVPLTGGIATASAAVLDTLGQAVEQDGTMIRSPRFAVNIENGCNGVETVLIFVSAVLAFPAPWKSRLLGIGIGVLAIQAVNLVRVAALFLTGAYLPALFDTSHTVIWQTVVVLFGCLLWIWWATRLAPPPGRQAG